MRRLSVGLPGVTAHRLPSRRGVRSSDWLPVARGSSERCLTHESIDWQKRSATDRRGAGSSRSCPRWAWGRTFCPPHSRPRSASANGSEIGCDSIRSVASTLGCRALAVTSIAARISARAGSRRRASVIAASAWPTTSVVAPLTRIAVLARQSPAGRSACARERRAVPVSAFTFFLVERSALTVEPTPTARRRWGRGQPAWSARDARRHRPPSAACPGFDIARRPASDADRHPLWHS